MQADELENKFVAVLNKKISVGSLMNALGHMAAGLVGGYPNTQEMRFDSYFDQNGGDHRSISDQLRTLRQALIAAGVHFVDFTSTMTVGTYAEQKERTKNTPEDQLEYYGVCIFGNKITVSQLTKKFSLWR